MADQEARNLLQQLVPAVAVGRVGVAIDQLAGVRGQVVEFALVAGVEVELEVPAARHLTLLQHRVHYPAVLGLRVGQERRQAAARRRLRSLGVRYPQEIADGREQVHQLHQLQPLRAGVGGARQAQHHRHSNRRFVQTAHLAGHAVLAELVAVIGHQHHQRVVERCRGAQRRHDLTHAVVQQRDQREIGGDHLPPHRLGIRVPAPAGPRLDCRPGGVVLRAGRRRQLDFGGAVAAGVRARRVERRMGRVDADEGRERPAPLPPAQVAVELPAGHEVAVLLRGPVEHPRDQLGILEVAVVSEPHGGRGVVGDRAEPSIDAVGLAEGDAVEAVAGKMVAEVAFARRQAVAVAQHAELLRIAPGDHRGARRHAHRVVGEAVVKRHRLGAQRVDVRSAHEGILLVEHHVLARLVRHDEHQVGHPRPRAAAYPILAGNRHSRRAGV